MNGGVVFGVDFFKEKCINEVLNDVLKNINENDFFKNFFNLIVGKSLRYSLNLDFN